MASLLRGPVIPQLPESLSKFVQEKTASRMGAIRLIPLAFPVFVMNPYEYTDNFKDILRDWGVITGQNIFSSICPVGEVWEIRNVVGWTNGIASTVTLSVRIDDGATDIRFKRELNAQNIYYQGNFPIKAGERIKGTFATGTVYIYITGVKRYA